MRWWRRSSRVENVPICLRSCSSKVIFGAQTGQTRGRVEVVSTLFDLQACSLTDIATILYVEHSETGSSKLLLMELRQRVSIRESSPLSAHLSIHPALRLICCQGVLADPWSAGNWLHAQVSARPPRENTSGSNHAGINAIKGGEKKRENVL